jgi:hypothetical protein
MTATPVKTTAFMIPGDDQRPNHWSTKTNTVET